MSLRAHELSLIAAELNRELAGAVVQKVYSPTSTRIYLECRIPGRSFFLLACSDAGAARLSCVEEKPPNPPVPPGWQSVLRRELTGAKFHDAEPLGRTLLLHFSVAAEDGTREPVTLVLETGSPASLFLLNRTARIFVQSIPARAGMRMGGTWQPEELPNTEVAQPTAERPSRLQSDFVFLRLAHGAEILFDSLEKQHWLKTRRAPLEARLKRLQRTKLKVLEDASRTEKAEQLKREGELLKHNMYQLKRGLNELLLYDYAEDGSQREVLVKLSPERTPQQEVEYRFHQYRRLQRGAQMAQTRLATLDAEQQELEAQLAALTEERPPLPEAQKRRKVEPEALPYREYTSEKGHAIWVGKGSDKNDALTFHVAKPHHLWFHARGVPGAHVVVPLQRTQTVDQELLLDAAHLAAFHSDAKGEPRAEVSYTQVKFVRKGRDAAPGAVTYTREKTLVLRFEADRWQRLSRSEKE